MVQVEHRKRFAGEEYLVVVQPDGTHALIPAWKSEETARSTAITGTPCLSMIGSSSCASSWRRF